MSFSNREFRIALLLVFLATATWLIQRAQDQGSKDSNGIALFQGGIDYYLNDVTFRNLGADGKPQYQLHATTARHRQIDDIIEMSDIKLGYFPDDKQANDSWQLSAGKGEVNGDQSRIQLTGNVVARRGHPDFPAEIRTSSLLISPKENILVSQAPVLIQQGAHTVRAQSMKIELDSSRVILSDGVKGQYVP